MASESIHEKLQRVRRPHVHIKYSVYVGDAQLAVELPFVVGVMGDFSGDGIGDIDELRDRKFKDVNRDNFDGLMKSMKPKLNLNVKNELSGNPDEELVVNLKFDEMEDFGPMGVAKQVPELKALLEKRDKIVQAKNVLERDRDAAKALDTWLKDPANLKALQEGKAKPPTE